MQIGYYILFYPTSIKFALAVNLKAAFRLINSYVAKKVNVALGVHVIRSFASLLKFVYVIFLVNF